MKTIAIVLNTSWNVFNFRLGLLKALQEEGYKIVIIAPKDEYSRKFEKLGFEYHNVDINNKGTKPLEDAKLAIAFYRLYRDIAPDVLLQYTIKPNIYGSIAAGVLGIPIISNISGLGTVFLNDSLSSKIARLLYRLALKVPKKIFFQNVHDRKLFVNSGLVSENKADLLPGSGIDTEKFKPVKTKVEEGGSVRFLFIARLIRDKGIMEYVEAAKKIQILTINKKLSAEFYILGAYYPGNPTAITEDVMQKWEDDRVVKYLGTSDDVKSVISKYDCVVLPSYREGLSRVLLEAASLAKPIITTSVPGCKDVVDDGVNGYLCEVKDSGSLSDKMKRMILLTSEQRKEMGEKGREKVIVEFDEKLVISKYKKAIVELIS
jgi:glycosyltransferase involved in cell wall biosynthesis